MSYDNLFVLYYLTVLGYTKTTTHISIGALWWYLNGHFTAWWISTSICNKLPPLRWIVVSYQQFVRRTDLISKKWYSLPIKYDVFFSLSFTKFERI